MKRYSTDRHGMLREVPDTSGMIDPVRCRHCHTVYDTADVHVIARHADCSVWISPCCGRQVDDRLWKGLPDIERLRS